jgi:hypothetical protein
MSCGLNDVSGDEQWKKSDTEELLRFSNDCQEVNDQN